MIRTSPSSRPQPIVVIVIVKVNFPVIIVLVNISVNIKVIISVTPVTGLAMSAIEAMRDIGAPRISELDTFALQCNDEKLRDPARADARQVPARNALIIQF